MKNLSNSEIIEVLKTCPAELRKKMVQSWLAFSVTNIVFTPDGKLILGELVEREPNSKAIPEIGDTCLIGGFNGGIVAGPCQLSELANAHLLNMLDINASKCLKIGKFTHCEFPAEAMEKPLNTPFGDFPIKRVAFERTVVLSKEQVESIKPAGKIKGITTLTCQKFLTDYCEGDKECRFKYQKDSVISAFSQVHNAGFSENFFNKVSLWFKGL